MELKEYQQRALTRVEACLTQLDRWRAKNERVVKALFRDELPSWDGAHG